MEIQITSTFLNAIKESFNNNQAGFFVNKYEGASSEDTYVAYVQDFLDMWYMSSKDAQKLFEERNMGRSLAGEKITLLETPTQEVINVLNAPSYQYSDED